MLKHEGYKIGQRIRSYDFEPMEGRPDHYVEGKIVDFYDKEYRGYVIKVDTDTAFDPKREEVIVPMEVSLHEYGNRVMLID